MLALGTAARIFLAAGVTDLRKSFDTLAAIVRNTLEKDDLCGDLFVFCNGRRNRIKILLYERGGYWLLARRLERGTFAWPAIGTAYLEMSREELTLLLGGIDVGATRRRRWYQLPEQKKVEE